MYSEIKEIFFNAAVQRQISVTVSNTILIAFRLAFKNENISEYDFKVISEKLNNEKFSDVTILTKFLLEKMEYTDSNRMPKKGNINTILRSVSDDNTLVVRKESNLNRQAVEAFCSKFREMNSLLQMLKYHRNQLAHNTQSINEIGWGLSVISSLIRLFEVGLVNKEDIQVQIAVKEKVIEIFNRLFKQNKENVGSKDKSTEKQDHNPQAVNVIEKKVEELKLELVEIEKRLGKKIESVPSINLSEFNKLLEGQSTILETVKSKVPVKQNGSLKNIEGSIEKEDELHAEDEEEGIDYVPKEDTYLTADTLRQELRNLRDKIKEDYKDDKAFGPNANLLHLSNIEEIIENEPKNFKEVIRLEGVRSNMDLSSEIIKKQMTEYGPNLDRLLSKVLWSSLFS